MCCWRRATGRCHASAAAGAARRRCSPMPCCSRSPTCCSAPPWARSSSLLPCRSASSAGLSARAIGRVRSNGSASPRPFAALVYLVSPGLVAPHPLGAALMAVAGFAWAAYTLIGRGSAAPLADTAGNFVRTVPVALLLIIAGSLGHALSLPAIGYAVASGVVASGLGYAVWYTALPHLTRTRAAIVQLTVPAIAGAGGVLLIGEPLTPPTMPRVATARRGVALALLAAERRKR
ncbi:MAG: EamA family transporter [Hyphomicrobiales bacterium]|nr:MAG: EamA family transporter [Hyphomicrobiales bacterium]